jgi:hypothetical protein
MGGPRPYGWDWPLHFTDPVKERMVERGFNALDVITSRDLKPLRVN